MKLSLSNGTLHKSLAENLAAVKSFGFENLEFNMKCVEDKENGEVYPADKFIEEQDLKCLTLHAATCPVENQDQISTAIYYGKVSANFAGTLGAQVMVVHSNVSWRLPANLRDEVMARIYGELRPYAKSLNVRLALENLSGQSMAYGKNVSELDEIFGVIDEDGTMGFTLDFCHSEATGQTERLLEAFHSRLVNVHLSDRAHGPFLEEKPRLRAFLENLKAYGYGGPLTLELSAKCSRADILKTKTVVALIIAH